MTDQSSAAKERDGSSVFIFDSYQAKPTFHDYGRIDRKKNSDVTRCGLVMWSVGKGVRYSANLPRFHAERFARPCRRCFPRAD